MYQTFDLQIMCFYVICNKIMYNYEMRASSSKYTNSNGIINLLHVLSKLDSIPENLMEFMIARMSLLTKNPNPLVHIVALAKNKNDMECKNIRIVVSNGLDTPCDMGHIKFSGVGSSEIFPYFRHTVKLKYWGISFDGEKGLILPKLYMDNRSCIPTTDTISDKLCVKTNLEIPSFSILCLFPLFSFMKQNKSIFYVHQNFALSKVRKMQVKDIWYRC